MNTIKLYCNSENVTSGGGSRRRTLTFVHIDADGKPVVDIATVDQADLRITLKDRESFSDIHEGDTVELSFSGVAEKKDDLP